jgi:hypothetical protein
MNPLGTFWMASGSISLALSLASSNLSTSFVQPAIAHARGEQGYQRQWLSQLPSRKLEDSIRQRGFIVLVLDSSNTGIPPLLNVNATYVDSNSNGLIDSGDQGFFNPGSTIKVMIAGQVLELLRTNGWQRNATYQANGSTQKYIFGKDIESMLVVSDNDATNRLIRFLGFKNIASRAKLLGLSHFEINRLMMSRGPAVASPAYTVVSAGVSYIVPVKNAPPSTDIIRCRETDTIRGNCASANDLLRTLRLVLDNGTSNGLGLAPEDRQWISSVMESTPKQRGYNKPDDYCRFLQPLVSDTTVRTTSLRSKCGVAPYTPTYLDLSRISTKNNRSFDILIAKKYNSPVGDAFVVKDFSNIARDIVMSLQ